MKKILKNQLGISLVEVLVAMGLAGMVSLAVLQINQNMIKGQRTMRQRSNILDLKTRMMRAFEDEASCSQTLANLNPIGDGSPFDTVQRANVASAGGGGAGGFSTVFSSVPGSDESKIGVGDSGFLTITSMVVRGYQPSTTTFTAFVDPADATQGTVDRRSGTARIVVSLAKPEGDNNKLSYGNDGVLTFSFDVSLVTADGTNQIVSCYSDASQHAEAACSSLGGTLDSSDGRCKDINVQSMNDTDNEHSITAMGSMQVENGLHVGDGVDAAGLPIGSPAVGMSGIGVGTNIPGRGEISSANHITAQSGDIKALGTSSGGNITAEKNIISENGNVETRNGNMYANGEIYSTSGSTGARKRLYAIGENIGGAPAIEAITGDIMARSGNLIGNNLQLTGSECQAGGTIIINSSGYARCVPGSNLSCPNTVSAGGNKTFIKAFSGYEPDGTVVCKTILTMDNSSCPDGQFATGYKQDNNGKEMKVDCVEPGSGCDNKTVSSYELVAGTWQMVQKPATEINVCANGYMAPIDDYGFVCPGNKPNEELVDEQPLVYGCETSNRNDITRVTRNFSKWTCGEPTTTIASAESAQKQDARLCRLGGENKYNTYEDCYNADGEVLFYSEAEKNLEAAVSPIAYGNDGRTLEAIVFEPKVYRYGPEKLSFCSFKQKDIGLTTGRSTSAVLDTCSTKHCKDLKAKVFTDTKLNDVRACPTGFQRAKSPEGWYYYEVQETTCNAERNHSLAQASDSTPENPKYLCDTHPAGSSPVRIKGGWYGAISPLGSQWYAGKIGIPSGADAPAPFTSPDGWVGSDATEIGSFNDINIPAATFPYTKLSGAYDTVTWPHSLEAQDRCEDNEKNQFHYAPFACYGVIIGMSCR